MYSNNTIVSLGPPSSPTCTNLNYTDNTSATLYWLPPVIADCVVNYDVQIAKIDDNQVDDTVNTCTNVTQYNITDLTRGQEYKYRVAANNNIATGSYSTYSQPFTLDGKYHCSLYRCITVQL